MMHDNVSAATEVPVKIEIMRGGNVTERRRVRLVEPRFEDLQQCVRQWACGEYAVRYTDSDGDEVTMDTEDEWQECVSLWRRDQHGVSNAAGQTSRTLHVTVDLSPNVPQEWRRRPHGHHHHHHGHWHHAGHFGRGMCGPRRAHMWEQQHGADTRAAVHGCRQGGKRGPWWRRGAANVKDDLHEECAAEGCSRKLNGVHPTHCCWKCVNYPGEHGPMCSGPSNAHDADRVPAGSDAWLCQSGCGLTVKDADGTHCCKKCARNPGEHGPHCSQIKGADTSSDEAARATSSVAGECASEGCARKVPEPHATHCCKRCARRGPGQHGPRCRKECGQEARDTSVPETGAEQTPDAAKGMGKWWRQFLTRVENDKQTECAAEGCTRKVTGIHSTHCCKRCARHPGQHGPRCEKKEREATAASTSDVGVRDTMPQCEPEVVVAVVADEACAAPAVGTPCATSSVEEDAVVQLRAMGFDVTDDVRAVLVKHGCDVGATLEQLL